MKNQPAMSEHLQHLEALSIHPSLKVSSEQRPAIVGNILHHLMHPYFLKRSPEMQGKFGEQQYQVFMQALADYCLREYVETPEPRLTVEFIKGLHHQFYDNAPRASVKTLCGTMTSMVPGEFKTRTVYIRGIAIPDSGNIPRDIAYMLERLYDEKAPLFHRYIQFMFDFATLHPFTDSNGKMALVLGDLFLLKQGVQPPYFAKYWWLDKEALSVRAAQYVKDPERDVSGLYSVVLSLYAERGLGLGNGCMTDANAANA